MKIKGFQTILFFPTRKKSEESILAGSFRTVPGLNKFVKENATIKFKADLLEYVESPQEDNEPEGEVEGAFNNDEQLGHLDQTVDESETEEKDEL